MERRESASQTGVISRPTSTTPRRWRRAHWQSCNQPLSRTAGRETSANPAHDGAAAGSCFARTPCSSSPPASAPLSARTASRMLRRHAQVLYLLRGLSGALGCPTRRKLALDLVDELQVELRQPADETGHEQEILLAVRELVGAALRVVEPLLDVGNVVS